MARSIQRKVIAQKSAKTGLAEVAAETIVRKGPRPSNYGPTKRADLEIQKYQRFTELLVEKTSFLRCLQAINGYLCEEEGFKVTRT